MWGNIKQVEVFTVCTYLDLQVPGAILLYCYCARKVFPTQKPPLTDRQLCTMLHHYVAVSLLLCLLTTSTSGQQNIKGEQLAFWSDLGSRFSTKSLIGSESVTMAALNGAALSGYGFFATYLDDSCATFESSIIYPLNTCFFLFSEGVGYFTKLSASSTEYIQENYSDNTCKTLTSTGDSTAYTTECNSKGKIFVQSSINAPTTKSTISYR